VKIILRYAADFTHHFAMIMGVRVESVC